MNYDPALQESYQVPQIHSRMGIASFIIAMAQGFVTLVLIVLAGILASTGPQQDNEAGFIFLGLFFLFGLSTHLVGVVLGIAGTAQKSRKKIFSILGLILNIAALLFVGLLILIGLIA